MAKGILICGRICSGKTTYAKRLCQREHTVLLSVDEILLSLFGQHCGDRHDEYADRTKKYLLQKSLELIRGGTDVVLDWGFWTKAGREQAKLFYREHGIPCELYYLDIDNDTWTERLHKRNCAVEAGETLAYYVDENLAAKFASRFERPEPDEIDMYITE